MRIMDILVSSLIILVEGSGYGNKLQNRTTEFCLNKTSLNKFGCDTNIHYQCDLVLISKFKKNALPIRHRKIWRITLLISSTLLFLPLLFFGESL